MARFTVNLTPGNKTQTAAQVKADMRQVKSGVVFNTERETAVLRIAVGTGLGHGWTRAIDNENTFAWDAKFSQAPKHSAPAAQLLAPDDPSLAGVSPRRYLNRALLVHQDAPAQTIGFLGTHLVSEANCEHVNVKGRAWREKTWKVQLGGTIAEAKRLHRLGIPLVLAGDFNTGKFYDGKDLLARLRKEFGGHVTHAHNGPLDHVFLIGTPKVRLTAGPVTVTKNSSDHDAVSVPVTVGDVVTPPPPEVPVPDDRYDKVTFRGKTVNKWTRAALLEAEARLGYELTIVQGSYHKGVGASAGTHDGGGAVDLAPFEADRKVKVLRQVGFAAWHRKAIPGLWNEHVHAILIGDKSATPAAQRQVTSYFNGRDGLKGNRADSSWRPAKIPTFAYPPKTTPKPPAKPKPVAQVVDYSFSRPSPAKLKAAGFVGAMRYISYGSKKDITKAEAKALHDAGLWIGLVFETTANRAGQGAAAGKADVARAEKVADELGYPKSAVIFYAVDYDADPDAVQPYFHAVKAGAKRPVGIYGSYRVVTAGFCDYRWQATAWSHGKRSTKAHLFQKLGAEINGTDENDLLKPFPCWKP